METDWLLEGSDQTIRVWDLSKMEFNISKELNIKFINSLLESFNVSKSSKDKEIENILDRAKRDNKIFNKVYLSKSYYPALSIFVSSSNRCVVWSQKWLL